MGIMAYNSSIMGRIKASFLSLPALILGVGIAVCSHPYANAAATESVDVAHRVQTGFFMQTEAAPHLEPNKTTYIVGEDIDVHISGFKPGEHVEIGIKLAAKPFGAVLADATGEAHKSFPMTIGIKPGKYELMARGQGTPDAFATIEIRAADAAPAGDNNVSAGASGVTDGKAQNSPSNAQNGAQNQVQKIEPSGAQPAAGGAQNGSVASAEQRGGVPAETKPAVESPEKGDNQLSNTGVVIGVVSLAAVVVLVGGVLLLVRRKR